MSTKLLQSLKALDPIVSKTDGRVTFVRLTQPLKADRSIDLTPAGISIELRLKHERKANGPIVVTLDGIVTLDRLVQP